MILPALGLFSGSAAPATPPTLSREFRAVWIATVYNIDWPSRPGLPAATQQAELSDILENARATGLNAVILQVRPAADAAYRSGIEPWSPYLSGKMGQSPGYDPLAFAIEKAHQLGLEFHAWFNPFRGQTQHGNAVSSDHITKTRPNWTKRYGNYLWLDPGIPDVREYALSVILDVLHRYDVDGIHIDDYFYPYPYPSNENRHSFPDEDTFQRFGQGSRDQWRRSNVDSFVHTLYERIKSEKPWVKFGISPFGIWRPGVPHGIEAGLDAYGMLYADSRKWLRQGWLDYLSPQLYWSIDSSGQSFPKLLDWWASENAKGRHLWPGLATDRIGAARLPTEIRDQIRLVRANRRSFPGHVHWNAKSLLRENLSGIRELLRGTVYAEPALVPESRWLGLARPSSPQASAHRDGTQVILEIEPQPDARFWLAQTRTSSGWRSQVFGSAQTRFAISDADIVAVSAIGRTGEQSVPRILELW